LVKIKSKQRLRNRQPTVSRNQGDQMSFLKNTQIVAQPVAQKIGLLLSFEKAAKRKQSPNTHVKICPLWSPWSYNVTHAPMMRDLNLKTAIEALPIFTHIPF
jgi:hypothetical protein